MLKDQKIAENIVLDIVGDIRSRSGLQNAWEDIDEPTQADILEHWKQLALEHLP